MPDDLADLFSRVRGDVEVEDWGGVCGEVMVAAEVDVGGCEDPGWLRWDREFKCESGEHREDVRVVGGDARGIVEGGDSTDGNRGVLCGGTSASVVLQVLISMGAAAQGG